MQRLLLFAFLGISALGSAHGAGCDRACLKAMLDQFVNAVVQHNPAAAPLSVRNRETENGTVRRPGTGLWQSAKALGKLQRRYLDPESGQAGYFGTLEDEAGTAVVTVRLKIEDRKITEAEWFLARKGDPGIGTGAGAQANAAFHDSDYLIAHPPAERMVPKAERLSRADMVAITNSYFDGLSANDGTLIIAHPGCVRLENGVLTTQRANSQWRHERLHIQWSDGQHLRRHSEALSNSRRGSGRGVEYWAVRTQAWGGDAAESVQRVVCNRAGQDSSDLFCDAVSRAGSDGAELAAFRRELARGAAAKVATEYKELIRTLANPVARRVVIADPDFASGLAGDGAADFARVVPDQLRVMAARAAAGVGVVAVVARLRGPVADHLAG